MAEKVCTKCTRPETADNKILKSGVCQECKKKANDDYRLRKAGKAPAAHASAAREKSKPAKRLDAPAGMTFDDAAGIVLSLGFDSVEAEKDGVIFSARRKQ